MLTVAAGGGAALVIEAALAIMKALPARAAA